MSKSINKDDNIDNLKKPRFYSRSHFPELKKIKCDDAVVKVFDMVVNKDGSLSVQVKEKYNQVDFIQSFRKDCDINELIKRYNAGDDLALNHNPGFYGDISKVPYDIMDVNKTLDKFSSVYNSLDKAKLKENYNISNLKDFINVIISGGFDNEKVDNKNISVETKNNIENNIKDTKQQELNNNISEVK